MRDLCGQATMEIVEEDRNGFRVSTNDGNQSICWSSNQFRPIKKAFSQLKTKFKLRARIRVHVAQRYFHESTAHCSSLCWWWTSGASTGKRKVFTRALSPSLSTRREQLDFCWMSSASSLLVHFLSTPCPLLVHFFCYPTDQFTSLSSLSQSVRYPSLQLWHSHCRVCPQSTVATLLPALRNLNHPQLIKMKIN